MNLHVMQENVKYYSNRKTFYVLIIMDLTFWFPSGNTIYIVGYVVRFCVSHRKLLFT